MVLIECLCQRSVLNFPSFVSIYEPAPLDPILKRETYQIKAKRELTPKDRQRVCFVSLPWVRSTTELIARRAEFTSSGCIPSSVSWV